MCSASSCKAKFITGPVPGQPGQSLTTQRPCCLCGLHVEGHYSGNQQPPCPPLAWRDRDRGPPGEALAPARTPGHPLSGTEGHGTVHGTWWAVDQNYNLAYFPAQKRFCHHAACPQYAPCVPRTGKHLGLPVPQDSHQRTEHTSPTSRGCRPMTTHVTAYSMPPPHMLCMRCLPECSAICGPSQHGLI